MRLIERPQVYHADSAAIGLPDVAAQRDFVRAL
jgi:hypothetical protein